MPNSIWDPYFEPLSQKIKGNPNLNFELIEKAFYFAAEAHAPQKRKTGEPYIIHPVAVAIIVEELGADTETIVSALLHDTVEDTNVELSDIRDHFGSNVAFLINGLTKIDEIPIGSTPQSRIAQNMRKMFNAMQSDMRIVVIKIADRVHNMQTMDAMKPEKQQIKAKETRAIYLPLAELLGIRVIKKELEDLCFKYLEPNEYLSLVNSTKKLRKTDDTSICTNLTSYLSDFGLNSFCRIKYKSHYRVYKKLRKKNISIETYPHYKYLKITIPEEASPYEVIEKIHAKYTPIANSFRDYIARETNNYYKALHTEIITKDGRSLRIKVMTKGMSLIAKSGILPDIFSFQKHRNPIPLPWLQNLFELAEHEPDDEKMYKEVTQNIIGKNIQCIDSVGNVINLPEGSTGIDFLCLQKKPLDKKYSFYIGNDLCDLKTEIKHNDIVQIEESQNGEHCHSLWFFYINNYTSHKTIQQFLKKEDSSVLKKLGTEHLLEIINTINNTRETILSQEKIETLTTLFKEDINDLLYKVSTAEISTQFILKKLIINNKYNNLSLCAKKDRNGFFQEILLAFKKHDVNLFFAEGGAPLSQSGQDISCRVFISQNTNIDAIIAVIISLSRLKYMGMVALDFIEKSDGTLSNTFLQAQID